MQDPVLTDIEKGIRLAFIKVLSKGFSADRLSEMLGYSGRSMADKITNPNTCKLPTLERYLLASQRLSDCGVVSLGRLAFAPGYEHTRPSPALINGSFADELCDITEEFHAARHAAQSGCHDDAWEHYELMMRAAHRFGQELRAAAGAPYRVTMIDNVDAAGGDGIQ